MSRFFVFLQYLLPHHFLSRFIGYFAEGSLLKNFLIRSFIRRYKVDMTEAILTNPDDYPNFNTFFTRELKPDARPIANEDYTVVSPADGSISQLGSIEDNQILQAKDHKFTLQDLLGGNQSLAEGFLDGSFVTVYLSPRDYHRVHLPLAGQLIKTTYIPGRLFSVNKATTYSVPNLFARNERAVCVFKTDLGHMCVIMVGAMIVAGIETVWGGQIYRRSGKRKITETDYSKHEPPIQLAAGAEIGRFKLGSTAIVLFPPDTVDLNQKLETNCQVRMGQQIGIWNQRE
ncbi:MAG: archaetidylserine decarboxylase [Pseudohongiellaceae bacterium]